ncbi:MAG: hypothetical protein ACTSPY_09325 [Candidatus Helarchaeota archaeon]
MDLDNSKNEVSKKDWNNLFTNPVDWTTSLKVLTAYLLILAFCFFVPNFITGYLNIPINVSELEGSGGIYQYFVWRFDKIIEIILMGPVFSICYYFLIKPLIKKIDTNSKKNKFLVQILEFGVVLSIGIMVAGHFVHLMFDYANFLYRSSYGYDTSELFLFLYWSDEWLGHHLIHFMFFLQLVLLLVADISFKNRQSLHWDEIVVCTYLALGVFIIEGYATYEGQSSFPIMVLSLILLISEVLVILIWRKNVLKFPLLIITILSNVLVIGFYIFWISAYGSKPYYPYIYQPSELSNEFDLFDNFGWIIILMLIIYGIAFVIKLVFKYLKQNHSITPVKTPTQS